MQTLRFGCIVTTGCNRLSRDKAVWVGSIIDRTFYRQAGIQYLHLHRASKTVLVSKWNNANFTQNPPQEKLVLTDSCTGWITALDSKQSRSKAFLIHIHILMNNVQR